MAHLDRTLKAQRREAKQAVSPGLTVEKLAVDCLDVRELQRAAAIFKDHWVALPMVSLRWPGIERAARAYRYLDPIEIPQSSRPSANPCFMDTVLLRQRPALAALCLLRAARGAIVQGDGRLLLPPLHRKSALRKPAPEQEGAGIFAGLPTCGKGSAVRVRCSIQCQNGRTA